MFIIAERKTALLACAALILLIATPAHTWAQAQGRDMTRETQYWEELKALAPEAVETFQQGTEALDQGDDETAARLYREVLKRAPDWDVAQRRLGYALVATGQKAEGLALLRKAVATNRSPENLEGLARTLAFPSETTLGSPAEQREALALAKEADSLNTDKSDPSYTALVAQLALNLEDLQSFRNATRKLTATHPDHIATHYYGAIRAAIDEDWATAEAEIKRAGQLGMPAAAVQEFLDETGTHTRVLAWRFVYIALGVAAVWALGIAVMFGLGKYLSRRTLRQLEAADPNVPTGPQEQRLRHLYRTVVNVAGFYYYISLPVVVLLLIGVTGAIIYAFLLLGRLPIKLTIILVVGALVTIYQMIRSLFVRYTPEDPGRPLRAEEAPGLWALAREVAATVGTRPVSEIRVTPGTEVAVYERGSFRARMNDEAERVLLVGVGVLNGFQQNAFRAVLAHEYGHFLGRDTAGGDVAFRVKSDMLNFARGIIASGQNTVWNLGFHFLRLYFKIFTIISHGAGRLQEVLADRLAAHHYGAAAFKEGLTHVVRRDIGFEHAIRQELTAAQGARRAFANLYELPEPAEAAAQRTIEEEFTQAMNRATEETDTHPSPLERFRLIDRVVAKNTPPATGAVWELFADRAALTAEMSASVEAQLKQ